MEKTEATGIAISESSRERKGKAPLLAAPQRAQAGGYKRGVAIFDLILRISAATAGLAAIILMVTADQTLPFITQYFRFQASYDDLPSLLFFVIAMSIATGYIVLSVPFSIVCIVRPRVTAPKLLLIIGDILSATLTMSAASASAAIVYLAHNGNSMSNWLAVCNQFTEFCQATSGAVVASFIVVLLLILLVLMSAFSLRKH